MTGSPHIVKLSDSPRLYQVDGFADEAEIARILVAASEERLRERAIAATRDETGFACELPVAGDDVLEDMRARMEACVGVVSDFGPSLRFRRYAAGQGHPPHRDTYRIADRYLVATAILYLCDTEAGGETFFPHASPAPLRVVPRKGRLVLWFNHRPDGTEDLASEHESLPVIEGEKATIADFIYAPLAAAAAEVPAGSATRRVPAGQGLRFHCVDDEVPEETVDVLRSACARLGVSFDRVEARGFDFTETRPLGRGDLVYRPAVSLAAIRVEQSLLGPAVASFYRTPEAALYDCLAPTLIFERAGLPIPRTVTLASADRRLLRRYVDWLGGFPVVLKWPGRSRGIGVVRADSFATLFSLADFAATGGTPPLLCQYIADATHYRLVVVGERVVAAYRNAQETDDFRSYGSEDPADYLVPVDPAMAGIAVAATHALQLEMAGVDILRGADGGLYLLEANFPCYFAQAQYITGVDIAGAMIDHLIRKSRAV